MRSDLKHGKVVKWTKATRRTPSATSDDFSDDPVVVFDVDLLPVPSCLVCDEHFGASGSFSCYRQLRAQSVIFTACNAQPPSSVDFLHFQHLCCIQHVEVLAGECMIFSVPQSMASFLSVPCCRQRIHY